MSKPSSGLRLRPMSAERLGTAFEELERRQRPVVPAVRSCKLVYMTNGVPTECGGEIKEAKVTEPFTMSTPMGSRPAVIFPYHYCVKCDAMSR